LEKIILEDIIKEENIVEKNKLKLLTDNISYFDINKSFVDTIIEKGDGQIYLTGILQRAEVPNQNRRIYPKHILEREVSKLQPLAHDNQLIGACDHPSTAIIEFKDASHKIVDMWWNGNDVMGKIQIIKKHPAGEKILALMEAGVKIGISSRGLGDTIPAIQTEQYKHFTDADVVDENFNLITFDLVANPSTHGSFMITEQIILEWNTNKIGTELIYSKLDKKLMYFIEKYK
jgi:hypothetical protein